MSGNEAPQHTYFLILAYVGIVPLDLLYEVHNVNVATESDGLKFFSIHIFLVIFCTVFLVVLLSLLDC